MKPSQVAIFALESLLKVVWWWLWWGIVVSLIGNWWGFAAATVVVFCWKVIRFTQKEPPQ